MSNVSRPDPETAPDATAPHPAAEGEELEDQPGSAAIEAEERLVADHPEVDHPHEDSHDAPADAHPAESSGWVLVPLVIGAVIGLVLVVIFGLGTA